MARELFINVSPGEIRIAERRDGKLEALRIEPLLGRDARPLGDIILGRVSRVIPAMEAAFVEIGMDRAGFLPLRDAKSLARGDKDDVGISDCVREGDSVLVQVTREPFAGKGAQLSAAIALPGRFLVMTPGNSAIAVSRKIENEARREELLRQGEALRAEIPDAGFIFRTAARDAAADELAADARELAEAWREISGKRKAARPPMILHSDLGPVERALRDMAGDVARILIDDAAALETARAYCRQAMPDVEARLAPAPRDLFVREGLEDEIAALASPRVELPSGGWITVEPTQALTVVDVNSGSYTQSGGRDETSMAVNLEAAAEIGRQLRLRDIGGLIVVDFIQLENDGQAKRIVATLKDSLSGDGAASRLSSMSEFGIVAITRRRQRAGRQQAATCAACGGTGRARDAAAQAQEILRAVEREAAANPGAELLVTATSPVADWFAAHQGEVREALSRRGAGRVRFETGTRSDVRRA